MNNKLKDRLGNAALIVIFLAVLAAAGYAILKIMTKWSIKGLG